MYFTSNIAYGMFFHEDAFPIATLSIPYPLARYVIMFDGKGDEMPVNAELREIEAEFPIQLIPLFDSEHYERHFVVMALRDNIARSNGEFAISVDPKTFEINSELVEEAKKFCEKYGLPEFKPEWLLFS